MKNTVSKIADVILKTIKIHVSKLQEKWSEDAPKRRLGDSNVILRSGACARKVMGRAESSETARAEKTPVTVLL